MTMNFTPMQRSAAAWAGDFGDRNALVPGGARLNTAGFAGEGAVAVTVGVAGAAQGATTVPVAALSGPIPAGTILPFGGAKFARLSAAAAAAATSLAVDAIPTALVSGDTASYLGTDKKNIPAGTPIGRTLAERNASVPYGPAEATDDEIFLSYHDVTGATGNADVELYRHGRIVKENFLPGFAALPAELQAKLRSLYTMTTGAP